MSTTKKVITVQIDPLSPYLNQNNQTFIKITYPKDFPQQTYRIKPKIKDGKICLALVTENPEWKCNTDSSLDMPYISNVLVIEINSNLAYLEPYFEIINTQNGEVLETKKLLIFNKEISLKNIESINQTIKNTQNQDSSQNHLPQNMWVFAFIVIILATITYLILDKYIPTKIKSLNAD